jgi:hypothetical protein
LFSEKPPWQVVVSHLMAPVVSVCVPTEQAVHWSAVPVAEAKVLRGQEVQVAAPALENDPAAQEAQADLPSEY